MGVGLSLELPQEMIVGNALLQFQMAEQFVLGDNHIAQNPGYLIVDNILSIPRNWLCRFGGPHATCHCGFFAGYKT